MARVVHPDPSRMTSTRSLLAVLPFLALTTSGCYGHRHGNGLELLAAGAVLGGAIVAAAEPPAPPPPPTYVSNVYYVYGPPPAPPPASARDRVDTRDPPPLFDATAARAALNAVDVSGCSAVGARGYGHAKVTISPDGAVSKVVIDEPAGMSEDAIRCVGRQLGATRVRPFRGNLVVVGTTWHVP